MKRLSHIVRQASGRLASRWAIIVANAAKRSAHVAYHVFIVTLSAGVALSLPALADLSARNFLFYWSLIEDEKVFLVSVEIAVAVCLILLLNSIGRSWRDRRFATMAKRAGMLCATSGGGLFSKRRIRRWKERRGFGRDLMLIGSTGFRTFADPNGDLHRVLLSCREAKIMLLDPESVGARARAKAILHPEVTEEGFRAHIGKSIEFLKGLTEVQKIIKLKLYQDPPLLKLAILGDYIWMQHYHTGLDVQMMPEYVFKHDQNPGSLYIPLYQYFLAKWNDPGIPEYDFETDMLVYRDPAGNEVGRKPFNGSRVEMASAAQR
jgi:hypothetical protein